MYQIVVTAYQVNHKQQVHPGLTTPTQRELRRQLSEIIYGGDSQNMRIFSYQNKAPGAPNVSYSILFH